MCNTPIRRTVKLNSSADAKNNLTVYAYNGFDRLTNRYYPLANTPGSANSNDYDGYTYDPNGNVVTIRRRSGGTITQTWDNLNRLTARTYPSSANNVQFGYDLRGLRTASQYANGSYAVSYAWDNAGRLLNTTAGEERSISSTMPQEIGPRRRGRMGSIRLPATMR